MLTEEITQEELEFGELYFDSQCMAESLFSNPDNLSYFDENKFINLRLYQLPFLSWEYGVFTEIPNLNPKQQFALRRNTGNCIALAARLIGKSWSVEKLDVCEYIIYGENEEAGFSSFDMVHIRGILEPVLKALDYHPIINIFKKSVNRSPTYSIVTNNGVNITSINMNISAGKRAGDQFFQQHFKRLWIEEESKENEIVSEKREESKHELNCVERLSGMTNFLALSPAGKIFNDPLNKKFVINLPAYVRPTYGEEEEQRAIKKYKGKESVGYRVFIGAEIIEEGVSALDMARIREGCYPHKKDGSIDDNIVIKNFEINQNNFRSYRSLLILERPTNADRLVIASDIGDIGGTTEIIILAQVGGKWRYLYNATLRNLDNKQNKEIFKYLYLRTNVDYLGIDCSDGSGKAIFRDLRDDPEIDAKKLIWVAFTENLEVGFKKDDNGNPIRENGKLVTQFENTFIWSIQRLCYLLYEPLLFIPIDYKFDDQFSNIVAIPRGNSFSYECLAGENHLFQAFQIFSIIEWQIEFLGFNKKAVDEKFKKKHINCGA
jgi:hypothetical protein